MNTGYVLSLVAVCLIQTCMGHHESEERDKLVNSQHIENVGREKRLSNKERFNNAFINDDWYVFDVVEGEPTTVSTPVMASSFNQIAERTQTTTSSRPPFPNALARRPPLCEETCNARTTPEYNPVCGDNGVTYNNNARLDCASSCGERVQMLHLGRCGPLLPFR
ncbi:uncharacterized protein CBL_07394 [Carabus blaptoides fortunei]